MPLFCTSRDLPAELRNEIYKCCLVRPAGIILEIAKQTPAQPRRLAAETRNQRVDPIIKRSLQILRLNKMVYCEAAPILYAQRIFFKNYTVMNSFLLSLRPKTIQMLTDIHIGGTNARHSRSPVLNLAPSTWALLRDAVNIKRLQIDGQLRMGYYLKPTPKTTTVDEKAAKSGRLVAGRLYGDCWPWLTAILQRDGGIANLSKILTISPESFRPSKHWYDYYSTAATADQDWTDEHPPKARAAMMDEIERLVKDRV